MASDAAKDTDVVTLKGMRFHARIGVLPHEAEIAQSIEVDASLWVRRGGARPTARDIVDYRRVYELVADVVTGTFFIRASQFAGAYFPARANASSGSRLVKRPRKMPATPPTTSALRCRSCRATRC